MHIDDIFKAGEPTISFEFFPPKTSDATERLQTVIRQLSIANPAFVSVTYGAGGSTRDATRRLVEDLKRQPDLEPVPHFTCVNHQQDEIDEVLRQYAALGIGNILALRGDPPRDRPEHDHRRDFCVQAADLVRHIRAFNQIGQHPDKRGFGIGVAGFPEGHPATPNRLLELDHLKAKVDAGANYICTQLFFDNHDFYDFRDRCDHAGIRVPILAGILPVTSLSGLHRMAELASGAKVPARLQRALLRVQDDPDGVLEIGIHHASEQCSDLLNQGVSGIHFYTLNQAAPTLEILKRIGRLKQRVPSGAYGKLVE